MGIKYYHLNHLGSVEVISTLLGTFEHVRYTPYGTVRGHYDANGNSLTNGGCTPDGLCREFTQYDTEPISNLEYAGARFYDPALGSFLTHDPAREFASPYSYVNGDPVNINDPGGACGPLCGWLIAVAIGFGVGETIGALSALAAGASAGEVMKAAAIGGAIGAVEGGVLGYVGPQVYAMNNPALSFAYNSALVGAAEYGALSSDGVGQVAAVVGLALTFAGWLNEIDQIGAKPAQGGNARPTLEEMEELYDAKFTPAQANLASDPRAEVVYGETAGLRPQPNDPGSTAGLQTAREMIADISERNPNVYSARPNPRNPIEMGEWQHAVQASRAAQQWNLPTDVRHFFLNQAGVGPPWPTWSYGRSPYATFGPFVNVGGGDVPRGGWTYIYIYRGVP